MGSPLIAGWIAHIAFWVLMVLGAAYGDLRAPAVITFLALWLAAMFGLPYFPSTAGLGTSLIAVLDVVLVFLVFKGDIRLT